MHAKHAIVLLVLMAMACTPKLRQTGSMSLKISENHRYFADASGKPVFWLGDTGWLLFSRLTREETLRYLDARAEQGFNVIQAMALHTLDACNVYGDSALVGRSVSHPLVTRGSDPTDPLQYDYWDHVDFVVDEAMKRHIHIALVPVWGSNVKSGRVSRDEMTAYGQFIAERYRDKANIIWLNGGDVRGSDSIAIWNILGGQLRKFAPGHLITYHPRGRNSSSRWFQHEKWLDFHMAQSGHRTYEQDNDSGGMMFGEDNWRFIQMDLAMEPLRPVLDGEPSYEEIPRGLHDTLQPRWTDNDLRRYAYWSVFAGAAGFTYGHNSIIQFYCVGDKTSAYGAKSSWTDALAAPGALQMKYLKALVLSRSYFDRVPDQSLVVGASQGDRYDYVVATRGHNYAMFYTYTGKDIHVDLPKLGFKRVVVSWFDPRTGQTEKVGGFPGDRTIEFSTPGEPRPGNDWVLIVDKK
ncbi:MAG: glycoside hydrolase family 140 protein [Breznakibacter sp.]